MSTSESPVLQGFIHALEQGRYRVIVQWALVVVIAVVLGLSYLGLIAFLPWQFRGFASAEAIDQAQVARELARGHGFSTLNIRPLAVAQLEQGGLLPAPGQAFPDTFNAPLGPAVNSVLLRGIASKAAKTTYAPGEFVHPAERAIAALSMVFFIVAVLLQYRLARRLFDGRLALLAAGLLLVCDLPWQFAAAGLPQNLLLLIFSVALLALARAVEARRAGAPGTALLWLALVGVLLGALVLGHGVAVGIFLGALAFSTIYFRPRLLAILALTVPFLLVVSPWLARNYRVSKNPFGIAGYALYEGVSSTTAHRMRAFETSVRNTPPLFFRGKVQSGVAAQLQDPSRFLGAGLLTVAFFVGLLYPFRRPETDVFRWAVLTMWLGLVASTAVLGINQPEEWPVAPGNLHVLFLPVVLAFGLALVLVLFSRLAIGTVPLWRTAFFTGLFIFIAMPMVNTLMTKTSVVQFPPYFPAAIARLNVWTNPNEVIGSDMPWAVGWYADRHSVWLPLKMKELVDLGDQNKLPGPLAGVFLSPVSRNVPFYTDLLRGDYQDWTELIFGSTTLRDFPFREAVPVGDPSMTFYSDVKRWEIGPPR